MSQPTRDVFISHAHQDKADIVLPLAEALRKRMISTWVDQGHIAPGESILTAVSEGLQRARYVIVVITPAFSSWTQDELAAALTRARASGEQSVVPVIAIGVDEYRERYPLLADRRAVTWSSGVEEVADEIAQPFRHRSDRYHIHLHRREYVGRIWTRIGAVQDGLHQIELLWGSNIFSLGVDLIKGNPISLEHGKQKPDQVHLLVRVEPDAFVTFGEGAPPDPDVKEIDEGWTRAQGWQEAEESVAVDERAADSKLS